VYILVLTSEKSISPTESLQFLTTQDVCGKLSTSH